MGHVVSVPGLLPPALPCLLLPTPSLELSSGSQTELVETKCSVSIWTQHNNIFLGWGPETVAWTMGWACHLGSFPQGPCRALLVSGSGTQCGFLATVSCPSCVPWEQLLSYLHQGCRELPAWAAVNGAADVPTSASWWSPWTGHGSGWLCPKPNQPFQPLCTSQ